MTTLKTPFDSSFSSTKGPENFDLCEFAACVLLLCHGARQYKETKACISPNVKLLLCLRNAKATNSIREGHHSGTFTKIATITMLEILAN